MSFGERKTPFAQNIGMTVVIMDEISSRKDPHLRSEAQASSEAFIDVALHDLEIPLRAARELAAVLQADTSLSEEAKASLHELAAAVAAADRQRNELTLLRLPVQCSLIDLAEVTERVHDRYRQGLERAGITLHTGTRAVPVWGDRGLLIRVLSHLVDNALNHAEGARNLWIQASVDGPQVRFEVRDDGRGWAEKGSDVLRGRGLRFCTWALRAQGGDLELRSGEGGAALHLVLRGPTLAQVLPHPSNDRLQRISHRITAAEL